ncbi:hypothetical protein BJ742DRAFT_209209 [Cladochytrium replicatum]|nr:hypothetical protein BJ742DRAFT_209209 [Cladochytrium replicatum]
MRQKHAIVDRAMYRLSDIAKRRHSSTEHELFPKHSLPECLISYVDYWNFPMAMLRNTGKSPTMLHTQKILSLIRSFNCETFGCPNPRSRRYLADTARRSSSPNHESIRGIKIFMEADSSARLRSLKNGAMIESGHERIVTFWAKLQANGGYNDRKWARADRYFLGQTSGKRDAAVGRLLNRRGEIVNVPCVRIICRKPGG